jgi:menaquinone-dependent protoporphyrinogen oxidase
MTKPLLVAYATKHGSTHEVATAIADRLQVLGHRAEVRAAQDVGSLSGYGGVVLGGALYMGRWHRDARRFLARHRDELAARPLAVYAMGPLTLAVDDIAGSRRQLDRALAKEPGLEPVSVAVFGGVVDPATLRFPFTHMEACDARDWDTIRYWTDEISASMPPTRATASAASRTRGTTMTGHDAMRTS